MLKTCLLKVKRFKEISKESASYFTALILVLHVGRIHACFIFLFLILNKDLTHLYFIFIVHLKVCMRFVNYEIMYVKLHRYFLPRGHQSPKFKCRVSLNETPKFSFRGLYICVNFDIWDLKKIENIKKLNKIIFKKSIDIYKTA